MLSGDNISSYATGKRREWSIKGRSPQSSSSAKIYLGVAGFQNTYLGYERVRIHRYAWVFRFLVLNSFDHQFTLGQNVQRDARFL